MGLSLNETSILWDWLERHGAGGAAATMGVPLLHFTADQARSVLGRLEARGGDDSLVPADVFRALGFERLDSFDISAYEGADHIVDLSMPAATRTYEDTYSLVCDFGTLEHVFNIPNALANMAAMIRPGGLMLHVVCMNNGVDHGFYQISPTLLLDYYGRAGFEVLESAALFYDPTRFRETDWLVRHVRRGTFGTGLVGTLDDRFGLIMMLCRKPQAGTGAMPSNLVQSFYADAADIEPVNPRWFPAFKIREGKARAVLSEAALDLETFEPAGGHAFSSTLPRKVPPGNSLENIVRSDLLLLEDGQPLGPMNALQDRVRGVGRGAYSHWQSELVFSTSDNTDPRTNGRRYQIRFGT